MRGLLFLAPAALALQPMKPVSYDAFELAAAEALKDELRANYQKRAARERSGSQLRAPCEPRTTLIASLCCDQPAQQGQALGLHKKRASRRALS